MLIKILDFSRSAKGFISEYSDLKITEAINALSEMEFSLPLETAPMLEAEYMLTVNDNAPDEPYYGYYTIKTIERDISTGRVNIYAVEGVDTLAYNMAFKFDNANDNRVYKYRPVPTLKYLLETAGITSWTVEYGDTDAAYYPVAEHRFTSEYQTVLRNIWDIAEAFNIEITFDTVARVIYVWDSARLGRSDGAILWEGINLTDLKYTVDTSEVVNRVWAFGAQIDGTESRVSVSGATPDGRAYVDEVLDLPGHGTQLAGKAIEGYFVDDSLTMAEQVYDKAKIYLLDACVPKYTINIKVADLAAISSEWRHFRFGLGDKVKIASRTLNRTIQDDQMLRDVKVRIVKITRYPDRPGDTTIEVSNSKNDLRDNQVKVNRLFRQMHDSTGDSLMNGKADKANTYTKAEVNSKVATMQCETARFSTSDRAFEMTAGATGAGIATDGTIKIPASGYIQVQCDLRNGSDASPLCICGINFGGSGATSILLNRYYVNGNYAVILLRNTTTSATNNLSCSLDVLYQG